MHRWLLVLCGGCHLAFPRPDEATPSDAPVDADPVACTDPELLACFLFEGDVEDGKGRNGTTASNVDFVAGVDGLALRMTAVSRVNINPPAQLMSQGEVTIETWILPGTARIQEEMVIDLDECWGLELTVSGQVNCYAANGLAVTTSLSLEGDRWRHVACTQVDDQVTIYIDGKLAAQDNLPMRLDNCTDAAIGGNAPAQQTPLEPLRANLDRLRIWDRVLTTDELAAEVARFGR